MILLVLVAASYGGHSINANALQPGADTIFYRIQTTMQRMQDQFWTQNLQFLRENRKKLRRAKSYIVIDETYDSYTGKILKNEKRGTLSKKEKLVVNYIHKYKPKKGDTGSFKYLVIAIVNGNKRRVLRVKAIKRKENYKPFIVQTLVILRNEVNYECAIFDRGFYDGSFINALKKENIPFIIRARISKTMKRIYGFYQLWKCYTDFKIGDTGTGNLILGIEHTEHKRKKWAFITNMKSKNWYTIRDIYRKRWNIENVFKATDGIQLKAQTNNPTTRLFCVCLSFLLYNAWQNKKDKTTFLNFVMKILEKIYKMISKTKEFYRDKLKINIPFWNRNA